MTADEVRSALADLDQITDALKDIDEDRRARLAELHKTTEAIGEPNLELELRWETQLAYAPTNNAALLEPGSARFSQFHPDLLSDQAISYLATRVDAPSAFVRARVRDFLWEHGGSRRSLGVHAAEAYLELSTLLEERAPREEFGWLAVGDSVVRAARLARQLNQQPGLRRVADRSLELMRRLVRDGLPRYVLDSCLALTEAAGTLTEDEAKEVESALIDSARRFREAANGHLERAALEVRDRFLRRRGAGEQDLRALDISVAESWIAEAERRQAGAEGQLVASTFFGAAITILERVGGQQVRINALKQRLRDARQRGLETELHPISATAQIDKRVVDAVISSIVEQPLAAALAAYCSRLDLTLNEDQLKAELVGQSQIAPLATLFPRVSLRSDGVVIAPTDPQDQRRLKIYQQALFRIAIQNVWLVQILDGLKRKGLTPTTLLDHLRSSGNFDDANLSIIAVGLERAWAGDDVSALHVLVPQLEDVLRNLLRKAGVDPMRAHQNIPGVSVEMILPTIVGQLEHADVLSRDQALMLHVVLDDLFGLNLRNDIAHGLIRRKACSPENMARVLQLYAMVAELPIPTNVGAGQG
jgi:hypothetical protein